MSRRSEAARIGKSFVGSRAARVARGSPQRQWKVPPKRDESLSEVAATVSFFDDDLIEQVDIQSTSDLINLIPNATIKGDGNGSISIRGISQSFSSQSPVATHLNGVWRPDPDALLGTFFDLESIQVQRGPVGTVYGRNATAGALNVMWRKPHAEYEVLADATVGNYSLYQGRIAVNVPLLGEGDERLTGRFVVQRETRDNYQDLLNRPSHIGGADLWYFRGSPSKQVGGGPRGPASRQLRARSGGAAHRRPADLGRRRLLRVPVRPGSTRYAPL